MRKYETVFISDPDLQDQARTELFDKVRNIIAKEKGILLNFDEWGNKKLAYPIRKKLRGHYVCLTYGGTGDLVKELERNFRLSDNITKFMTILLSDNVNAEDLEKEVLEAKEAEEAAKAAKAASVEAASAKAEEIEAKEEIVEQDTKAEETSNDSEEAEEIKENQD